MLLRPGEFIEAASELVICCKKAFVASDLDSSGEDEIDGDAAPELMDVLVETLLSLLPQSSAPMRSAIEQVGLLMAALLSLVPLNVSFKLYSLIYLLTFLLQGHLCVSTTPCLLG